MRELKFRAWSEETESFECFDLYEGTECGLTNLQIWARNTQIEQYTGLKDKNGKEIYEGDIVKGGWLYGKNWQVVKYQNYGFYPFIITDFDGDSMVRNADVEVIGNVHENADLLEDEE